MQDVRYARIKVPSDKKAMRDFFNLVEIAKKEKIEYFVVMTPDMLEQLKTEKMMFDKIKGGT